MPKTIRWEPPTTPFTIDDVAPLGVTRAALRTAQASGRLVSLARGVYVAAAVVPQDQAGLHLLRARAQQVLRPRMIASHHTAALAWGLPLDDPDAAALTPPAFTATAAPGVRSSRDQKYSLAIRDLPADHRVAHPSGLVVTTPARAAVDVASDAALPAALITLDGAARHLLADRVGERRMREHYNREGSRARAQRPLLEAAAVAGTQFTAHHLARAIGWSDPCRESPLESLSFGEMVCHGLPLPQMQVRISTPEGDFYPDFLWADARLIGEADGMSKYVAQEVLAREKQRQEALERLGFLVIRWGMRDIRRHPAGVMARLAAAIEARTGR